MEHFEQLYGVNAANMRKKPTTSHWIASSLAPWTRRRRREKYTTTHGVVPISITRGSNLNTHDDDDDEMLTSRSEGGHVGSISQTRQANHDHSTRRATATTHMTTTTTTTRADEDPRASPNEKRAAAPSHADDSREESHLGSISHQETENQPRLTPTE